MTVHVQDQAKTAVMQLHLQVASHSVEVGESCAGLHLTGHRG